jgi:glycosyltransferase EpsF
VSDYLGKAQSAADLFVFPSFSEGLGIALIEAQTNGLPSVVSEGIPKEADVANAAVFCGLDEPPSEWAKCIYELKDVCRKDYLSNVRSAGYDVRFEAKKLQEFYVTRNLQATCRIK